MLYTWKVRLFKHRRINLWWRRWQAWRGHAVGNYDFLPQYVHRFAPGKTFADIGCMWGVNGRYSFQAEAEGALEVKAVDVFGPTPEFEQQRIDLNSDVEFILGDVGNPEIIDRIGPVDVVLCAGVLYHHPSPFDLLVALRRICQETLILRTFAILEVDGLPNAAVYFPMLSAEDRQLWNLASLGVPRQIGITDAFEPDQGYGNYFWGLTPSCLRSLLKTAGFEVMEEYPEPFAHTVICRAVAVPFYHRVPGEIEARDLGQFVSATGIARPA